MLLKTVDVILRYLGKPSLEWADGWKRNVCSPRYDQQQIDSWSCGLFVMSAITAVKCNILFEKVDFEDMKEDMRTVCLRELMKIP